MTEYTAKDFKKGQPRWCPGCGDHFFLASLQKAMAEIGVPPYETAVISGIGCSSRLPYYMNTYAMQTIHGRAAAIATGVKVVNPKLTVWQISGDGDGLAIGGNHFIHANRRNIDINMILINNTIILSAISKNTTLALAFWPISRKQRSNSSLISITLASFIKRAKFLVNCSSSSVM